MADIESEKIVKQKAKVITREQRKYLLDLFKICSKGNRKYFFSAVVLQVIAISIQSIAYAVIISHILSDVAQSKVVESIDPYIPYLVVLAILEITALAMRRVATYLEERFDAMSRKAVVSEIYARLLEQPAYFHQSRFVGVTINLIGKCSDCFGRTSGLFTFSILSNIVVFIGTGVVLIPRMPLYFLVMVAITIGYAYAIKKLLPNQMKLSADVSDTSSKLYGAMSDGISNIAAVKAESSEESEHEHVQNIGDEFIRLNQKFARRVLLRDTFMLNAFIRSLRILSVVFAVLLAVGHSNNVSNIFLATTLTLTYLDGLWQMSDSIYELTVAYGEAAPLVPILRADIAVADKENATDIGEVKGSIEIKNLAFAYPNTTHQVFEGLSLKIHSGERIGFVGKSGAGKSTLVKLVMRFIDPSDGSITIDGESIYDVTQESLRRNISYVAQEPMLFHRTVKENITYGSENVTDEQIADALKRSHCEEFIKDLPHGLNSIVGERGVNLSGGQRQRIAIARAMLKNAPILILDEATSALDSQSEHYVQEAFANLMKERTTLVVAHRLSTLLNMDRIVVLDKGKIAEEGNHKELVANSEIYSSLWEHQRGGFISE